MTINNEHMFEKEGRQYMNSNKKFKEDLIKAMEEKTTVLFNVFCDTASLRGVSKIEDVMFEEGKIEIFADNVVMNISNFETVEYDEIDNMYYIKRDKSIIAYIMF